MGVNHVVYGGSTLVDLRDSTVTAATLAAGATAYNAAGNKITGTMVGYTGDFLEKERLFEILGIVEKTIEDYFEPLEYIVSTGAQYIDTGIAVSDDLTVEMAFTLPHDQQYVSLFGSQSGSSWSIVPHYYDGGVEFYVGTGGGGKLKTSLSIGESHSLEVAASGGTLTVTIDGVTQSTSYTTPLNSTDSIYIFTSNFSGEDQSADMILTSCRIKSGGSVLRDYVPRRRILDGAVGLLDLANGVFYESASGVAFLAPGELPSGYTRLEYIESTGSGYINTGFAPNQDTRVVIDVQPTSSVSGQTFVFGTRNTASPSATLAYTFAFLNDAQVRSDFFGSSVTLSGSFIQRLLIDKNKNTCTVNGEVIENSAKTGQATLPIFLMSLNNTGAAGTYLKGLLYSCQIYDNGTIVRDYIPVKNSSGVAGLFDMVGMTFYASASSTAFVAGPVAE
ncbi:MAG: hypothetical protein IJW29_06205 [Clostridia bacterium]|nr:hypothetical protein [Clostridia bacterium]